MENPVAIELEEGGGSAIVADLLIMEQRPAKKDFRDRV